MRIVFNGEPREADDCITVAELLEQLNLVKQRVAVEVNRQIVPRDLHHEHVLRDGDEMEVVTLVGGG